jgi:hypothetical protein
MTNLFTNEDTLMYLESIETDMFDWKFDEEKLLDYIKVMFQGEKPNQFIDPIEYWIERVQEISRNMEFCS